jgi:hypothetical protein
MGSGLLLLVVGVVVLAIVVGVTIYWQARARRPLAGPGSDPGPGVGALLRMFSRPRHGAGPCSYRGCPNQQGWLCSYRERSGRQCQTRWCDEHVAMIAGQPYCPRHAGVVKALQATAGTIREVKRQPALEDRAVPLLTLICDQLDASLMQTLRDSFSAHPGVQVASRSNVQEVWVDNERVAWQRSWGAFTQRGYLVQLSVRVGVPEPPVVQAVVANHVVFQRVPDWISDRLKGLPPDPSSRSRYCGELLDAVRQELGTRLPTILEQLDQELLVGAR